MGLLNNNIVTQGQQWLSPNLVHTKKLHNFCASAYIHKVRGMVTCLLLKAKKLCLWLQALNEQKRCWLIVSADRGRWLDLYPKDDKALIRIKKLAPPAGLEPATQ